VFFRWWKTRRRQKLIARPFPSAWEDVLRTNVHSYGQLAEREQARVRDYLRVFIAEKNWEGCRGFSVTDEVKVTIAAQVAVLMLGFEHEYFDHVLTILVYPEPFVTPDRRVTQAGVVIEGESALEGEAWYRGPVILSWADALEGASADNHGDNLVLHEFAHQLDMLNGRVSDGVPPMESSEQFRRWTAVMGRNFRRLVHDCQQRRHTLLDCYGATNMSEFFAVATERFFQRPTDLQREHPDLYGILSEFYRQDPASRAVV
jgi:Mlc titration factor MtfA (ptsG expression regulator)